MPGPEKKRRNRKEGSGPKKGGVGGRKRMDSGMERNGMDELEYPQGLKWTRQRKSVYRILWNAEEPLNAAQIYHLAEQETSGKDYAPSTVYRILTAFEELGLVEKTVWMGEDTAVYSLNRGSHTHYAVCLQCHKRIPLRSCPFAHIRLDREPEDFTVVSHKLELYGYCRDCVGTSPSDLT